MSESILLKALKFASKQHRGQLRDNGIPFIVHPVSAMGILMEFGETDREVLAAAVLHDVVEDCGVDLGTLEVMFGTRVAGIVNEVTKLPDGSFPLESREGFIVKMADRLSNLNDLKNCSPEKVERYIKSSSKMLDAYAEQMVDANKFLYFALRDAVYRLRIDGNPKGCAGCSQGQ